jgi:hypothetical protein
MKFDKTTFCSAPWFQIRNDQTGTYRACCQIDTKLSEFDGNKEYSWPDHSFDDWLNSEYAQYLRQNLTKGIKLKECANCWKAEQHNEISLRTIANNTLTGNRANDLDSSWVASYLAKKIDYSYDFLLSADVKLTNVCNFACGMCSPVDSTQLYNKWNQNQQHPWVQAQTKHAVHYFKEIRETFIEKNNHQLLIEILEKRPRYLKLLGGEPLLDKVALQLLADYPYKSQCELQFITNGSVDLVSIRQALGNYKKVFFTVSLEGTGAVQDWMRQGSDWNFIEQNLLSYIDCYTTSELSIHHTMQNLTVRHLPDLIAWSNKHNIPITLGFLDYPECLQVSNMPVELANDVVKIFESLPDQSVNAGPYVDQVRTVSISGLTSLLKSLSFDSKNIADIKVFLDWHDPNGNWCKVFPEWDEYFRKTAAHSF